MAAARKPSIRYTWERQRVPGQDGAGKSLTDWRVNWALHGANGELMCDSAGQGYQDKSGAEAAVDAVAKVFIDHAECAPLRETGPGRKPKL